MDERLSETERVNVLLTGGHAIQERRAIDRSAAARACAVCPTARAQIAAAAACAHLPVDSQCRSLPSLLSDKGRAAWEAVQANLAALLRQRAADADTQASP